MLIKLSFGKSLGIPLQYDIIIFLIDQIWSAIFCTKYFQQNMELFIK